MLDMLESSLNKSKNRNVRFVKIRSKRNCSHCGKIQQEAIKSGAVDFLVKPFLPSRVLDAVKKALVM